MLFAGFAMSQVCSFLRNAMIGYGLSRGDFGIAATITIALQMLDTLSDLGADRLLVQAADGDDPRLMATAHTTLVARGIVTALILFAAAPLVVAFFAIPSALHAFQVAALVPAIKGFMHLDARRQQRNLQNRNFMLVEVVPQVVALAATLPVLRMSGSFEAVVWLALLQSAATVLLSHVVARRGYRLGLDRGHIGRLVDFGWPIWLSAFPLVVVYQGDRVIVGRLLGMDALAAYSAAFMVAMVPGLLAAKVGQALILPLLSSIRDDKEAFRQRYLLTFEGACIVASAYLVAFVVAGGEVLALAFGKNYQGLGGVIAWLAAMWALRMVQSVPGMVLMATGDTRPLLVAGIIRACALVLVIAAAHAGWGLSGIAAAGVVGEFAAIAYVLARTARDTRGLALKTVLRTVYPMATGLVAAGCIAIFPMTGSLWLSLPVALVLCTSAVLGGLAVMPAIRTFIELHLRDDAAAGEAACLPAATTETAYAATHS